jgi:hypothetical protein
MMQSSTLKWLLIVLMPITMGWKVVIQPENPGETRDAVFKFLKDQKFDVRTTDESIEDMPIIEASSDTCHLRIARVSPLGHEAELVRRASKADERIFYVFRGADYSKQPIGQTLANYFWFKFLRELGLVSRVPPVFAVMTSCAAERLPWTEMGAQQPT